MSNFEKGDRLIATDSVPTGVFSTVSKGTQGVVAEVVTAWFADDTFAVHWENGEKTTNVRADALARLAKIESDADGCALLVLVGALSSAVLWRMMRRP